MSMSIRRVETVDAEWYTVRTLAVPEGDVAHMAVEDLEGNDQHDKHIVTGDADQPPVLEAHVLRDYDDQAEVEEIERLIQMGVLVEPVPGEEAEARLVARQYRWATDMEAEDTFPPASIGSLLRHIVVLAQTWATPIWVCDVEDAYLNVEQPKDAPVVVDAPLSYARRYGPKRWKLGRILPGQCRGAQEWFLHLNVDLEAQGLEAMIEVPTLYRATSPKERKAAQVHVDDAMLTGDEVNGPFFPGDEFEFLKRRFRIEADGSITVRAAAHFYLDIYNLLGEPRLRNTPGPVGDLFMVDNSKVVIQFLGGTSRAQAAKGASIMNFAAHDTYNQHLQAELVALTQTVGESILIHKAWEFLTCASADHVARSDSSVARAIASRLGVGRVKHLQTSSLWIQQWVHRKELRVAAIGTALNPTDMGTKILSANRLRMLCAVAGMVDDGGNKVGKEELQAELYKTKGVNAKTLHLVQLLMASTLQGCSHEGYEDASVYLLFCLDLLGTFYEEHPTGFTVLLVALVLLAVAFLGYLNGVQWRMTLQIGRWPNAGLEPGCGETGPAQTNEPKNNKNNKNDKDNEDTEDIEDTESSESDQGHRDTEQGETGQGRRDTEQGEIDQGRRGTEQGETGRGHQREAPLDPEVVNRMNAWMEENVLPLLGVAPEAEARPSGATSSHEPPPVPPGYLRTTRGVLDPTGLNLGRIVRYAPNWGYGYHVATCSSFRRAARSFRDSTVQQALERGLLSCEQCCRGDHDTLSVRNRGYFEQKPRRRHR
ncbi:unnamed protein product [Symbiodinium necroappetens]|uniref:Reverse transcriptase Ty1/copia-type domain-containing protein n=1 Tax=Symbiodinium necroappetens TaxID=1628268 RepID=A0A813A0T0_9DINO|nr:unnamed protein product [Symbiodinium necroappetens]